MKGIPMSNDHKPTDGDTPEVITSDLNDTVVLSENEDGTKVIGPAPIAEHVTFQGEPNGLPPAAPEVQLEAPEEVKKLREWFHLHVKNSVHSQDTAHYNNVYRMTEALAATLHSKHPVQKET